MRKCYGLGFSSDAGDAWASVEPRTFKRDGTVPGVIFGHGASSVPHPALALIYNQLMLGDAGFAVADTGRQVTMCDAQNNAWGNDASSLTVADLRFWQSSYLGSADDELFLMGGSMGFTTVLNFAHWVRGGFDIVWLGTTIEPPDVDIKAVAGMIPLVDHNDVRARNYAGYASSIVAAYGGQAAYDAARPTHNPIEYADALTDLPIKIWYSTNDAATLPASVEAFAQAADADLVSLGDVGHSYWGMDLTQIPEFFDAHA